MLDYDTPDDLYTTVLWNHHVAPVIRSPRCESWFANAVDSFGHELVPMPGTQFPDWGEKHWGCAK